MIDDKFIVFHRADVQYYDNGAEFEYYHEDDAIDDAVVIRKQDTFASAALFGYAASICVVIDNLKKTGHFKSTVANLQEIADYFQMQAEDALNYDSRLPD